MEQTPAAALPKSTPGSWGQQVGCRPALCPRAGLCELEQSQQVREGHCSPLEMLGDISGVTEHCSGLCDAREAAPLEKFLGGSPWRAEHQACEERLEKLGLFRRGGTNCNLHYLKWDCRKKRARCFSEMHGEEEGRSLLDIRKTFSQWCWLGTAASCLERL